jgi:hypothetical protein
VEEQPLGASKTPFFIQKVVDKVFQKVRERGLFHM